MLSLGIMQGRLTPSGGRGIQFFPFDNWENEFIEGEKLGLNEIEWIFDYDRYQENPLWTSSGVQNVRKLISSTNVKVRSVCFDYFMRRAFYKVQNPEKAKVKQENLELIKKILESMSEIGASLLEIPFVDDSSIQNEDEESEAVEFLNEVVGLAASKGIMVGCETDMPPGKFKDFLDRIGNERICANYDTGNSSGLGYDHRAEILSLGAYIANVHIKDREFQGITKELGTGSANFDKVFSSLKEIGYNRSIIFQAARGVDEDEAAAVRGQIEFVRKYCYKYRLE